MPRNRERGQALRRCFAKHPCGAGRALAEFALMIPVLILLLFGMIFAAFYAFRSAAVDWGVFVTGVATGAYNRPATGQARESVLREDLADRLAWPIKVCFLREEN